MNWEEPTSQSQVIKLFCSLKLTHAGDSCFQSETLEQYSEYVDSQRQSCQAPKCCVENSDLVTAAGDGDLEKVRVLRERISKQIFSVFLRQKLKLGGFLVV